MNVGKFVGVVLATSVMFVGVASASEAGNVAALERGKPAGVQKAVSWDDDKGLMLLGGGVVIAGIVLVATGTGHGSINATCSLPGCTTTTTTTSPATTTTRTSTTTTTSTH